MKSETANGFFTDYKHDVFVLIFYVNAPKPTESLQTVSQWEADLSFAY